jgi:hypothetical protein
MMRNNAMRLSLRGLVLGVFLALLGQTTAFAQSVPKCGPGSAISNARVNAALKEQDIYRASKEGARKQTEAAAACQLAVNEDVIRAAIPDALNGVASLVKNFNPTSILSNAATRVGSMVSQEGACKVANNVLGSAGRSVVGGVNSAANQAIYDGTKDITNPINRTVGDINQTSGSVGAGVYTPGVSTPRVDGSTSGGSSHWDTMTCKILKRC